jgi:predicted transcriptional regulator
MLERLERIDALEAIQRGLEQMERGEGRPAEEVFAAFRARHGMPNA